MKDYEKLRLIPLIQDFKHAKRMNEELEILDKIANVIDELVTEAETKVKNVSAKSCVSGSLSLSDLPKLLQWLKEREISWDSHEEAWEEFVGHDTPNYYTTEELIKEWKSGNDH